MILQSKRKKLSSTVVCFCLIVFPLFAQTYPFRYYGNESAIPDGFVYALCQDSMAYLWLGTRKGISKFDGFEFHDIAFPDSASGRYPTCCITDPAGNPWFGCSDGTIFFTRNGAMGRVPVDNHISISVLAMDSEGFIWAVPQADAIYRIDPANPENIQVFRSPEGSMFFSAEFTGRGELMLGSQENISLFGIEKDSLVFREAFTDFDYSSVTAVRRIPGTDSFLAGTNGNGLYIINLQEGSKKPERLSEREEHMYLDVQEIYRDEDNVFWVSTNGSGVFRLSLSPGGTDMISSGFIDMNSGLPANNIRTVFRDLEGNYWIGHFGEGLSMLPSLAFAFYSPGMTPEANNIICVNSFEGSCFLGTPTGYYLFDIDQNSVKSFTDLRRRTGNIEISAYCTEDDGRLWIGTAGAGLYLQERAGQPRVFYRSGNSGEDYILNIENDENYLWLGTLNGVIILDRSSGKVKARYNTNNGLPYNRIDQICLLGNGSAAIATKTDRIYTIGIEGGVSAKSGIMRGPTMNVISSCFRSSDGSIWAATAGNGVFEFRSDSVISYTRAEMLLSDYCYSILADSLDRIWIGHERGFSCYDRQTGTMKTYSTGFARGGACNPAAMYEAPGGRILIGTTQGAVVYDPEKDYKSRQPPRNNINFISVNDVIHPYKKSFSLPYKKRYRINISYVGISFRDPDKVYYQTILDNWDDDWSGWSIDREVTVSPRDGRFRFSMNSVNEEGLSGKPVTFDLVIRTPVWRTWWFMLLSAAAASGLVIFIVRQREKVQKRLELYLKTELEARTEEVVRQKGEIELKNVEITDSISYAKRIQTSILPDLNKLKDTFSDAFILFRPRDIVSGDFYWFDRFGDDKFMLVCADSTGHGVPGAFMSMIGSTLLQDIIGRQHITRPSVILKTLDTQLFSTLNQNVELGVSNDGMDMVVCEIGLRTGHIRFASAMRPVIMILGGEFLYVKGNRSSIGGESYTEKFFDDQEYYLKSGDSIYLFTDGYPDQFGGKDGKKMKIARLKSLVEEVRDLPMDEQREKIAGFLDDWQGENDQVDDILMMGIRF